MEMRRERIESKQQQLRELILQQVSFKSLVTRNKEAEERGLVPSQNSAIQLPFITVNTHKKTQINCSISDDKYVHIVYANFVYLSLIKNSDFFLGLSISSLLMTNLKYTTILRFWSEWDFFWVSKKHSILRKNVYHFLN